MTFTHYMDSTLSKGKDQTICMYDLLMPIFVKWFQIKMNIRHALIVQRICSKDNPADSPESYKSGRLEPG